MALSEIDQVENVLVPRDSEKENFLVAVFPRAGNVYFCYYSESAFRADEHLFEAGTYVVFADG